MDLAIRFHCLFDHKAPSDQQHFLDPLSLMSIQDDSPAFCLIALQLWSSLTISGQGCWRSAEQQTQLSSWEKWLVKRTKVKILLFVRGESQWWSFWEMLWSIYITIEENKCIEKQPMVAEHGETLHFTEKLHQVQLPNPLQTAQCSSAWFFSS